LFTLEGGTFHELADCSFRLTGFARRLGFYTIGEPRIPRGLDPATAWDHPFANYHPVLRPCLLYLWQCDWLGLALGRPGIAGGPGSVWLPCQARRTNKKGKSWHACWTWQRLVPARIVVDGSHCQVRLRRKMKENVKFRYREKTALITGASPGIKASSPVST